MLVCNNLNWKYGENEALCDLSCSFTEQALTMILGPNGSGKTTLMKLLSGSFKPQKGELFLDGESISQFSARTLAKKIAYVAQGTKIEYDFTVEDIVLMGRYAYVPPLRTEKEKDFIKVHQAMAQTGVLHLSKRSVQELSGGELQRVLLARALAQDCKYLLLDEPITGLDISHQLEFLALIKALCQERSITAICVLHDLELAYNFGEQILLLNNGKAECHGVPQDVLTSENIERVYGTKSEIFERNKRVHIAFYG